MPAIRKVPYEPLISGKLLAVDTETTGLDVYRGDRPFLYNFANDQGQTAVVWEDFEVNSATGRFRQIASDGCGPNRLRIKPWMADSSVTKIFHNSKFDLKMLAAFGVQVSGPIHDTMIMAHTLNASGRVGGEHVGVLKTLSLNTLARKYLGDTKDDRVKAWLKLNTLGFRKERGRSPNFSDVPRDIMEAYAAQDVVLTMRLFYLMNEHLDRLNLRGIYNTEMRLVRTVIRMEDRGVRLDIPYMHRRIQELRDLEAKSLKVLQTHAKPIRIRVTKRTTRKGVVRVRNILQITPVSEINFASDHQMAQIIYGQLGFPVTSKTDGGFPATDERTICRIDHPFCREAVSWRQYRKARATYFESNLALQLDGVLHGDFIQIGTYTGRFSSHRPNLQNAPTEGTTHDSRVGVVVVYKGIKRMFISRPGYRNYHFDYKQIELVMLAHFANDPRITATILSGRDIHSEVAAAMFGTVTELNRVQAKVVTFGTLYGMGRQTFAWKLKTTLDKVDQIMNVYYDAFPGVREFQQAVIQQVQRTGEIRNMFGRRYLIDPRYAYKGVNYLCQGSAADIMKRAMVRVDSFLQREAPKARILMTIHDELVIEIPEKDEAWLPAEIVKRMIECPECKLPLKVPIEREGASWEQLEKVSGLSSPSTPAPAPPAGPSAFVTPQITALTPQARLK